MVFARVGSIATLALACFLGAAACISSVEENNSEAPDTETPAMGETASDSVSWDEVESPAGGTVKQLTLSGPEVAAMVACDQQGFVPFSYRDTGLDWVGCQVPNPSDAVGPESALLEPQLADGPSPVGGTVPMITLPGPQSAITVLCNTGTPFLYEDQGTWVGCQG